MRKSFKYAKCNVLDVKGFSFMCIWIGSTIKVLGIGQVRSI